MNIVRLFICFGLFVVCAAGAAFAQDVLDKTTIENQLNIQKAEIEFIEPILAEGNLTEARILEFRHQLRKSRGELQKITAQIKPVFDDAQADLADLGPPPVAAKEGETPPPEPENIQRQRSALTDKSLMAEGLLKQSEALTSKTTRMLEKVAAIRRGQFVGQLFETQTSPFNLKLWANAFEAYRSQIASYKLPLQGEKPSRILGFLVSCFVFLALLLAALRFSQKSFLAALARKDDSSFSAASASLILPLIASGLGLFLIYQTLNTQGIITEVNEGFAYKGFGLTAFLILVYAATKRLAKAQIIRRGMRWLALIAVGLFAVDTLFLESGKVMGTALELAVAQSYLVTTIFAVLLGLCSLSILKGVKEGAEYFFPKQLFYVLLGISVLILASNIFGYAAFSRYLFERIVLLFSIFALVLVVRAFIRPYFCKLDQLLSQNTKPDESEKEQERLVYFWLSLSLDLVLFFVCLPIIANTVGAEWEDIQDWITQAFFGFKIGAMTISIANIGIAILVFLVLLFVTRIIQRILGQKILPKTKMDESIRQSITQVLGYAGLIIALMAGISAVGFDLTNLALIAGALSVGIGFGLQSIVSNFVSGLILLFERPIKVNDWIITNSGEGIVKKISVRATEIETFDRTSIIVPNSELIASSVKNWTHKDKVGRVIVPVGVAYHSDPHQVRDILLRCVEESAEALKSPEPNIFFKDFGDSALLFEVRFFIKNIRDVYRVSTDMRFKIWDAFKDADVEISFPQRDLHIRSAEGLKGLIGGK